VRPFSVIVLLIAAPAFAQDTTPMLDALGRAAAIFSHSVPGLMAREHLAQKGRRAVMEVAQSRGKESIDFVIPEDFVKHEVVSDYSFGEFSDSKHFHEKRTVLLVDSAPPNAPARHALTMGDVTQTGIEQKSMLEDIESGQLQGAAADFGPFLLLFTKERQSHFEFRLNGRHRLNKEMLLVINYRQIAGNDGLTDFRDRSAVRHPLAGQIWMRDGDFVPARITVETEEILSPKFVLRNEAAIDYAPTLYGLAPAVILHRQYLNRDLLVENRFTYTDYHGSPLVP
jgi:hypothetical protein